MPEPVPTLAPESQASLSKQKNIMKLAARMIKSAYMNPRNRSLLLSLFFTLLIAGVTIYLLVLKKESSLQDADLFTPSAVTSIQWTVGTKNWSFERPSGSAAWSPEVLPERVDQKLSLLSRLSLSKMAPPKEIEVAAIRILLKFNDASEWQGLYYDDKFFWLSGPHEGKGTVLSATQSEIFREGRYAFDPLVLSWCTSPITRILFEYEDEAVEIQRSGSQWEMTDLNNQSKSLDAAMFEEWLKAACEAPVQAWVDLEHEAFGIDDGTLEVEYTDGTRSEFSVRSPTFLISEEQAAVSPELFRLLNELFEMQ